MIIMPNRASNSITESASEELLRLVQEVKDISAQIGAMKRERNRMEEGPDKEQLIEDIRIKKYQVIFYLWKMRNVSRERRARI